MIDFKLTSDLDLDFSNKKLELVKDDDFTIQSLRIRLKTFYSDWFLDNTAGVKYFGNVFDIKKIDIVKVESMIREVILNTDGIAILDKLEIKQDKTDLLINFTATTINGSKIDLTEGII